MNSTPLATIAITTKDQFSTFKLAVSTARNQTYPNLEILIIDNASQDNTKHYLKHLEEVDPRIKVIRHAVSIAGVASIHQILHEYNGEYLSILSNWDRLDPNFMSQAVEDLTQHKKAGFWYCNSQLLNSALGQPQTPAPAPREESGLSFLYHRLAKGQRGAFLSASVFKREPITELLINLDTSNLVDLALQTGSAFRHTVVFQAKTLHQHHYSDEDLWGKYTGRQYIQACKHFLKAMKAALNLKRHEQQWLKKCLSYHALRAAVLLCARDQNDLLERGRILKLYAKGFFPEIISNFFTFGFPLIGQHAENLLKLLLLWKQPKILRSYPIEKVEQSKEEAPADYHRRVIKDMLKSVLSAMANDIDIDIWGESHILYAGKYFAETLNQQFQEQGLKTGKVVIEDPIDLPEGDEEYIAKLIDEMLKQQWLRQRPQREWYNAAVALRRK